MRNVFDQYSQPENRITHALMTALHEDAALLRSFLKDLAGVEPKAKAALQVHQQTYPGSLEGEAAEGERKGIPDAWVTCGDDWCLLIENKVLIRATRDQLTRHLATARRLGFNGVQALVLTVGEPLGEMPEGVRVVEWTAVYGWLLGKAKAHPWAKRVAEFLEVIEGKLAQQEQLKMGTLTTFAGFPFGREAPFTYGEAKRALGLARGILSQRGDLQEELDIDPSLPGRPAVTGQREDSVWDFLQLRVAREGTSFTSSPHLTLAASRTEVQAMVTVPHAIRTEFRNRVSSLEFSEFQDMLRKVLGGMQSALKAYPGMEPRVLAAQRRYPAQRSVPNYDASLDFDLRTAFDGYAPKKQIQWLQAVHGCVASKKSNFQFQVGAVFPYARCEATQSAVILDGVAKAWIATKPLISCLLGPRAGFNRRGDCRPTERHSGQTSITPSGARDR